MLRILLDVMPFSQHASIALPLLNNITSGYSKSSLPRHAWIPGESVNRVAQNKLLFGFTINDRDISNMINASLLIGL